jgi:serine/threonine protein kinase/WD40 repeat protein
MNQTNGERDPLDVVAESFLEHCRRGAHPSPEEYAQRHPELADRIRALFPTLLAMEEVYPVPGLSRAVARPSPGPAPERLGEYRIVREVGRGGMGVVYEAVQEPLGRRVALKVLPFHAVADPIQIERFRREARAAARLHHTNIVPVFGVGEHEGTHFYAMQFIQGQGLEAVLHEVQRLRGGKAVTPTPDDALSVQAAHGMLSGRFRETSRDHQPPQSPVADAPGSPLVAEAPDVPSSTTDMSGQTAGQYHRSVARLGVQAAEALDYAHRHGVLHRDVKPSNLLLDTEGTVWVTDFGLAKAEDSDSLTQTGDLIGTLRYLAPERFAGRADARSDVYSLGLTLYEMLTLRPGFAESDRARLVERVLHETVVAPRRLDPALPRDLETILLKATAREPEQRYQSAAALAEDLRQFLAERPIRARRASPLERFWRWCRRNPMVASLLGAVATLLVVIAAGASVAVLRLRENLARATQAETNARDKLWDSRRDQARALRLSRRQGQRFDSLQAIRKAMELPLPAGRSLGELRNEAASALALPDVEVVREWEDFDLETSDLRFDRTLTTYVRTDWRGKVTVRRVADDALIAQLPGSGSPADVRMSPDGRFLAVHDLGTMRLKAERLIGSNFQAVHELKQVTQWGVEFSPDSQHLICSHQDNRISLLELAERRLTSWPARGTDTQAFWFRPDGRQVAVRTRVKGEYVFLVCDLPDGTVRASLPDVTDFSGLAWHPQGRMVAVCHSDGRIGLWDTTTWQKTLVLEGHKNRGITCFFTPDGDQLLSRDWGGVLRLWEVQTGRLLFSTISGQIIHVSDGRLVVRDGTRVQLLRLEVGREFRTLPRRTAAGPGAYAVEWQHPILRPDGRLLALATEEGTCSLVDPVSGTQLAEIPLKRTIPFHFEESGALLTHGSAGVCRWPLAEDRETGRCRLGPPELLHPSNSLSGKLGAP